MYWNSSHLRPDLQNGLFPRSLYAFLKKTTEINIIGLDKSVTIGARECSLWWGKGGHNVKLGDFIISAYTLQSSTLQVQRLSIKRGHTRCSMRESHIEIVAVETLRWKIQSKGHDAPIMHSCLFLLFVQRTYKVETTSIIQAYKRHLFISFL